MFRFCAILKLVRQPCHTGGEDSLKKRPSLWTELILALLCIYGLLSGATMNAGMINPRVQMVNLLLIGLIGVIWLLARFRGHWRAHFLALDGAALLWALAILLSLLSNLDLWRRIAIGMWYAGLYALVWALIQDLLLNRVIRRQAIWDALLLAGAVMILLSLREQLGQLQAYFSLSGEVRQGLPSLSDLIRLEATTNNPNRLATIMIGLLPLVLARVWTARTRLMRIGWSLYAFLVAEILLFTFSRAGWLSAAAALGFLGALGLAQSGLISPERMRRWWAQAQGRERMRFLIVGGVVSVVGIGLMILAGLIAVKVSSSSIRASDQRGVMYQTALNLFGEKPITGYGLFTFGRGQIRYDSMPPRQVHSHAHSLPLTIAAELGLIGLAALALTALVIARASWLNWRALKDARARWMLIGGVSALAGMGVHHLLDFTALTAAIALMAVLLAASVTVPANAPPLTSGLHHRTIPLLWVGLFGALLITGVISTSANAHYFAALFKGFAEADSDAALTELDQAIQRDPQMPAYYLVKGFLAAEAGFDPTRSPEQAQPYVRTALEAYQRFTVLEPFFAPAWANLGALYERLGEPEAALESLQRAVQIAPDGWEIVFNYAAILERQGQTERAREAYRRTLEVRPDSALSSFWSTTPLRREILSAYVPAPSASETLNPYWSTLLSLKQGDLDEALKHWEQCPPELKYGVQGRVVNLVLAITQGQTDPKSLDALWERVRAQAETSLNKVSYEEWLDLAQAYLHFAQGELDQARAALAKAKTVVPFIAPDLPEIISSQFLRLGVGRILISGLEVPQWTLDFEYLVSRLEQQLP